MCKAGIVMDRRAGTVADRDRCVGEQVGRAGKTADRRAGTVANRRAGTVAHRDRCVQGRDSDG